MAKCTKVLTNGASAFGGSSSYGFSSFADSGSAGFSVSEGAVSSLGLSSSITISFSVSSTVVASALVVVSSAAAGACRSTSLGFSSVATNMETFSNTNITGPGTWAGPYFEVASHTAFVPGKSIFTSSSRNF
uniref:Uncharacterized protein n=1 Tax=Opuntia streptacantha TaxID=393608 RepID=A0A7C9CLU9_OPUST